MGTRREEAGDKKGEGWGPEGRRMGTRREEAGDQKGEGWGPEGRRMGTRREKDGDQKGGGWGPEGRRLETRREKDGDQKVGGWGPEGRRMGTGREDDKGIATLIWCVDNPATRKFTRLNYPPPPPPHIRPHPSLKTIWQVQSFRHAQNLHPHTHLKGVLRYLLEVHTS